VRFATALLLIYASIASAQSQLTIQFEVQSAPLGDVLRSLAAQVNANIIYDPSLVTGQNVQGFAMRSTLDEALTRVLHGTGLKHQYVNEKTVTLVRVDPQLKKAVETATANSSTTIVDSQSTRRVRK
jgi:Secretin and TonB N terminus short domain